MMATDFTGYAGKACIRFKAEIPPEELRTTVLELVSRITLDCAREGAWLIGHVKCLVEDPHEEFLSCSVTDQGGKAKCHGNMSRATDRFILILNVLLYGLADELVERIALDNLNASFGNALEMAVENLVEDRERERKRLIRFEEDRK
ncbi:hypothetical protein [Methanomassiliicoccus luminyensis]|jgi:hypothetical protein|uniref:hypothetical protein n=1 Tax=Methanomassiliicoccus luminyensis TaxID=1080712 RepID=UPI000377B662|nr:hypothetical protein [Methanomassiliicoccus luminyensis]